MIEFILWRNQGRAGEEREGAFKGQRAKEKASPPPEWLESQGKYLNPDLWNTQLGREYRQEPEREPL